VLIDLNLVLIDLNLVNLQTPRTPQITGARSPDLAPAEICGLRSIQTVSDKNLLAGTMSIDEY
jgi:hypothetical protein